MFAFVSQVDEIIAGARIPEVFKTAQNVKYAGYKNILYLDTAKSDVKFDVSALQVDRISITS